MTSILTNTGAMTALQTLRGINSNLAQTQNEISTGKMISSAKDNSAIWAISKVMESDVAGFKAIKSSLSLGESSVAVARNATESITGLLTDIKARSSPPRKRTSTARRCRPISASCGPDHLDRQRAQFNGLNLIQGTDEVNILSSLDRAADGTVTSSNITVDRQDMTTAAGSLGAGTSLNANATVLNTAANALNNDGNTAVITLGAGTSYETATGSFTVGGPSSASEQATSVPPRAQPKTPRRPFCRPGSTPFSWTGSPPPSPAQRSRSRREGPSKA
jgi:flagellin